MPDQLSEIARLYRSCKFEELLVLANDRLVQEPTCRETRFFRAETFEALERFDEAFADWTAISAADPDDAAPLYFRARLQLRRGRYAEAIADFDRAYTVDDGYLSDVIRLDRAWCYLRLRDFQKVRKEVEEIPPSKEYDVFWRPLQEALKQAEASSAKSNKHSRS